MCCLNIKRDKAEQIKSIARKLTKNDGQISIRVIRINKKQPLLNQTGDQFVKLLIGSQHKHLLTDNKNVFWASYKARLMTSSSRQKIAFFSENLQNVAHICNPKISRRN